MPWEHYAPQNDLREARQGGPFQQQGVWPLRTQACGLATERHWISRHVPSRGLAPKGGQGVVSLRPARQVPGVAGRRALARPLLSSGTTLAAPRRKVGSPDPLALVGLLDKRPLLVSSHLLPGPARLCTEALLVGESLERSLLGRRVECVWRVPGGGLFYKAAVRPLSTTAPACRPPKSPCEMHESRIREDTQCGMCRSPTQTPQGTTHLPVMCQKA